MRDEDEYVVRIVYRGSRGEDFNDRHKRVGTVANWSDEVFQACDQETICFDLLAMRSKEFPSPRGGHVSN
jgi:hypothetical protein